MTLKSTYLRGAQARPRHNPGQLSARAEQAFQHPGGTHREESAPHTCESELRFRCVDPISGPFRSVCRRFHNRGAALGGAALEGAALEGAREGGRRFQFQSAGLDSLGFPEVRVGGLRGRFQLYEEGCSYEEKDACRLPKREPTGGWAAGLGDWAGIDGHRGHQV